MTSQSPLDRLAGPGSVLSKEPPDATEFAGLVESGLARLADAQNTSNSLYGRFDLAYSAAHALCLAALRYLGYRSSKRYIVFLVRENEARVRRPRVSQRRRTSGEPAPGLVRHRNAG
jgi:hypothetical protein